MIDFFPYFIAILCSENCHDEFIEPTIFGKNRINVTSFMLLLLKSHHYLVKLHFQRKHQASFDTLALDSDSDEQEEDDFFDAPDVRR